MIYLTSDTHFGHNRSFIYEPRGFKNIYEHDKKIINNWNSIIQSNDDIFHLGDIMLNDNNYGLSCIKQLKGQIHVVRGNHDTDARMELYNQCYNIVEITEGQFFKWNKYHFYLSHYPTLCANSDEDKPLPARMISLCGHTHTNDKFADMNKGLIYHVELDAHQNTPVLISTVVEDIKNYIERNK